MKKHTWVFKNERGFFVQSFAEVGVLPTSSMRKAYKIRGTEDYAQGIAFIIGKIFNDTYTPHPVGIRKPKMEK